MKEMLTTEGTSEYDSLYANNNGETDSEDVTNEDDNENENENDDDDDDEDEDEDEEDDDENDNDNDEDNDENDDRQYAMLSTEWISAIGEELGMYPLPDAVLQRLAEDASYRLREVLYKCVTRLKHSRRNRLTAADVNAVITDLCDVDPVLGALDSMPEYHAEANVFVPDDRIINLVEIINDPPSISQINAPFLQESEVCDIQLTEARNNYAKSALITLLNGSQNTFQVLINDCATNAHLGGEGVIDKLMFIARSMVISNNAQYTRVSTRTCQLIIAIASNSEAVYPYHLTSVEKLTELLLELLLGQSFINTNLEALFKECALKLMLRWPSVADTYIPTLETVLLKEEKENGETNKTKTTAMELLASVQPLTFFQSEANSALSLETVLKSAPPGSNLWHRIALATCALMKSQAHPLNLAPLIEHYGDSLIPYLPAMYSSNIGKPKKAPPLPIIIKGKIRYLSVRSVLATRTLWDRQTAFPDSTMRGPRREIRFAFAGGRPVPPSNLRRVSLRANYQILRNDVQATLALVASRRLLVLRDRKKKLFDVYDLARVCL